MYKEDGVYLANSFTVRTILLCLVTYTVPIVFGAEYVLNKQNVRIAVIGDHGLESTAAKSVAELVTRWDNNGGIDAVVSTGDVNYPRGSRWTIDANVGQYWREFIFPYKGRYQRTGPSSVNRFWPCPGNHDYANKARGDLSAYLDYMPVKRRRFYDIRIGPVHFFSLDSMYCKHEVFPVNGSSIPMNMTQPLWRHMRQAHWLYIHLKASTAPWKIVYFHHPPYSSGSHGSSPHMRWPFQEWGATAVLCGHDHSYERMVEAGTNFPYFVNGMGGAKTYGFQLKPENGSVWRFTSKMGGAQLIEANSTHITFRFYSTTQPNNVLDCYSAVLHGLQDAAAKSSSVEFGPGVVRRDVSDVEIRQSEMTDAVEGAQQQSDETGESGMPGRRDVTITGSHLQNHDPGSVIYRDCRLVNLTNISGDFEPNARKSSRRAKPFHSRRQQHLVSQGYAPRQPSSAQNKLND